MNRLEVLVDGEWTPVPLAEPVEFTLADEEPVEAVLEPPRTEWTLDLHMQGQAFGRSFQDAMLAAERQAFANRCAARMWLAHPYRPRGAH